MINGNITILESETEITKRILKSLLPQVDRHFKKAFNKCKSQIVDIVSQAITSSPTYNSLINGQLKAEFGLDNASGRVAEILNFWKNLTIEYKKPSIKKDQIIASFSLSMIKADYSDVFTTAAAVVSTEKGAQLEWLQWLLLFGDKTIIREYDVQIGPNSRSRSGNGIMVSSQGGRWSVPSAYSGTSKKNWITQAVDSVENNIMNLLSSSLG